MDNEKEAYGDHSKPLSSFPQKWDVTNTHDCKQENNPGRDCNNLITLNITLNNFAKLDIQTRKLSHSTIANKTETYTSCSKQLLYLG